MDALSSVLVVEPASEIVSTYVADALQRSYSNYSPRGVRISKRSA